MAAGIGTPPLAGRDARVLADRVLGPLCTRHTRAIYPRAREEWGRVAAAAVKHPRAGVSRQGAAGWCSETGKLRA